MSYRLVSFLIGCFLINSVLADPPVLKNDPQRPVADISKDLGVSQDEFVSCFNNVKPTPGGGRPESAERVHSNKKVLLSCLKGFNTEITNESLDTVMDRYRPGGRDAQRPVYYRPDAQRPSH